MSLLIAEPFHYNSYPAEPQAMGFWDAGTGIGMINTAGRIAGTNAVTLVGTSNNRLNVPGSPSTVILGFALRLNATFTNSLLFQVREGTTNHLEIFAVSGQLRIVGPGGTIGTTALPNPLVVGQWYYVEFKFVIGNSGSVEIHVNNGTALASTSGDTQNGGSGVVDNIKFVDPNTISIGDLYVCDTAGSLHNDFLGEIAIYPTAPTGDGASTDFVASAGSPYQCVDDAANSTTDDGDTTYVEADTAGNRGLFTYPTLTLGAGQSIIAVCHQAAVRKTDGGSRQIKLTVRSGGTNYDGGAISLTTGYLRYYRIDEVDPDTGVAWTASGVSNAQAGLKVEV